MQKNRNKFLTPGSILIIIILFFTIGFLINQKKQSPPPVPLITDFETCRKAGYPLITSNPPQCSLPDGKTFSGNASTPINKKNQIHVENPEPGASITSPLQIKGEALGTWFFEGSFLILLLDDDGMEISKSVATAQGEWMTENFVPFIAEISFDPQSSSKGTLILRKDNPSGLPENDEELRIPVIFSK